MSSRTNLTGQLDHTIRILENEIEETTERLTRLSLTRPVGVNVPSPMSSPTGRTMSNSRDTRREYGRSEPLFSGTPEPSTYCDLPNSVSTKRYGKCINHNGSSVQHVIKPVKPVVEPDNYDGKTNFEDWLTNLNLCSQINNWTLKQKTKFLAVKLRGPALQVYTDLPESSKLYLDDVVKALRNRFSPQGQSGLYRAQLKVRSRRKGEALPELASDIRRLISKAYPDVSTVLREELGRDHFVEALDSPDVRMQVRRAKPQNLEVALTVALEEEAFLQVEYSKSNLLQRISTNACQTKSSEKVHLPDEQTQGELKNKVAKLEQTVKELKVALQQNRTRKPRSPLVCWNCNLEGHRHFECPYNRQPSQSGNRPTDNTLQENRARLSMGSVPSQQ